jgi:DNA-binding NarL/FixJ family response regulator
MKRYGAADAPPDCDAPGGQRLAGIGHELAKADSAQARQALLRAALRAAGFDALCYMRVSRIGDTINRLAYFNAFSPTGWAQRYLCERFYEIDARLAYSSRHEWPMLWDLSTIATAAPVAGAGAQAAAAALPAVPHHTAAVARTARFAAAAREAGILSGVSFGLGTPDALDRCVVIFSSAVATKARLPAPQLHRPTYSVELSDIQRSILEFVTRGLNDKDIAERIGTSHHNVDYYVRQLKKLYRATNRVQLAYIAGCVLGASNARSDANL